PFPYFSRTHLHLHSFPTRRSSDLALPSTATTDSSLDRNECESKPTLLSLFLHRARDEAGPFSERLTDLRHKRNTSRDPKPSPSRDRKSTRLNSSHVSISYAVFCLK